MSTPIVRYVYVRNAYNKSGPITVAYRFNDSMECIEYNHARCSKKDQFVKAKGRLIATARLLYGKKHPNEYLAYAQVGVDGVPSYSLIAAEIYARFSY